MERHREDFHTVLGLDLGSNSLGWALLEIGKDGPRRIVDSGVRIFEAGMEGDIETGRATSRAAARGDKRALRRQYDRRRRRRAKILHQLQRMGLLPEGKAEDIIPAMDRDFLSTYRDRLNLERQVHLDNLLPYWLRKEALDRKLQPYEIGRALYHLSQRRGFLSNRKTPEKEGDEQGKVDQGIAELSEAMAIANARTLGEYFASLNPHQRRIRQCWTHRSMYEHEFEAIWIAQARHYPDILTADSKARLHNAIFHQRPLKSAKSLIGKCQLEPNHRRAAWSHRDAQRFRYLQTLNNCRMIVRDTGEIRDFTPEERATLIEALEEGDFTFAQAKKRLGFKSKDVEFTLEAGGEKRFAGNRVNQDIAKAIGDTWFSYPTEQQEGMIVDLRQFREEGPLAKRAMEHWGLDREAAGAFARVELEPGYANLSLYAMRKILPLLEQGIHYATARKQVYGDVLTDGQVLDLLPPVLTQFDIRNPVVIRSLTEMRKVVNCVVRKYGKPSEIHIELAREMKQGQRQRQRQTKTIRENEARRKKAADRIRKEMAIQYPSRDDILKVQLADECNWICPYTGKSIRMSDLVGGASQYDIEHIIPFSRSLDDSFLNKTLCYHEENRNRKKNRMPHEAYHGTEQWDTIIGAVSRFKGHCRNEKLRRFRMTKEEWEQENGGFVARQLNDTRYASRLAAGYLGLLYGGYWDSEGHRRVFAITGRLTGILRALWDMNAILGDGDNKERSDHRHHAIDAVAIAITSPGVVQGLADHALPWYERKRYRGRFRQPPLPWKSFHEDLQKAIGEIVVSHRVSHRVNGPLHEESNYGPAGPTANRAFHIRRSVDALKQSEIKQIADPRIRIAVERKLAELGQNDPGKAFSEFVNHPVLVSRNGKRMPIHTVRIRVSAKAQPVGKQHPKYCVTGSNHHMEILAVLDKDGKAKKWEAVVVTRLEAMDRIRSKKPVVQRDHGPRKKFLFSVAPGDTMRLGNPGDWPELLHIRTVSISSAGSIEIAGPSLTDARLKTDIRKSKQWYRITSLSTLQKLSPSKVIVLPDGVIQPVND